MLENLQFVRLKIPRLIPIELVENVKGRTFSPEQFYKYQEYQISNPNNHLYALIDKANKIQGYMWAEVSRLDECLWVNTFSINKEYWGKGEAIKLAEEFLKPLSQKIKAPKTFWVTTNEKFFIKKGFRRSKNSLMEYRN